ncbi:hypothetical protein HN865_02420, partial [Candidatus Woesearchaeota archaeon]|nr:hypothetical protein [Candidatus Woesearchaeota archaeon]
KDDNVEIINLGVPGYGVNNQYVYFLEEGLKYDPDIVMIQYCTNDWGTHSINTKDNKIIVDYNNSFVADENGFLIDYLSNSPIRSIHLFMLRNLRSYSFIYTKSRNSLSRVVKVLRGGSDVPPPFLRERDSLEYQENYEGYYKLLSSLKDNADAEVVIFAGPQPEDIWDKEKIKSQFDMKIVPDIRQTQKDLEYASEELNLYFINLESYDEDIFIEIDGHWNAKGNKLVADTLYDELNGILF